MRIPARLLIIALLAVASFIPIAIAQQSGTVNVRPRVASTRPGVPEVKVTADRNRVPFGEPVTFALSPASVVMNSSYKVTLYFGDGAHQAMRQTVIDHLYRKPGNYTYSILVELSASPTPTPIPVLGVKLSANPTSVETNRRVDFAAQLSQSYPNIKYRFVFDDGSQTSWQSEPTAAHEYRLPKIYQTYVDIGVGSNGSVKQIGGSLRQVIKVTQAAQPSRIAVKLTASSTSVVVKSPITFTARADSNESNIRYRFDFGEGSTNPDWQASPQTKHTYSSAGTYTARVDARVINSKSGTKTASSNPLPIEVNPAKPEAKPAVNLTVNPQSVLEGLPVFFAAVASSAKSNTRYRFNFGDGSPPTAWTQDSNQTHAYKLAGNYPAFVEISSSSNEPINALASSEKKRVRVRRMIPPPPTPTPPAGSPTPTPPRRPTPSPSIASPTPSPSPLPTGNPSPTGSPNASPSVPATPSPSPDGTSSPVGGVTTPSPGPTPSVSETPSPTPPTDGGTTDDWWKYIVIAAIILFAAYQAYAYFFPPRPTFVPHVDPGDSKVGSGKPLSIDYRMDLDPDETGGRVEVDTHGGSFIKSERSSND